MGKFKDAVVTAKGQALLAKAVAGTTKLEFTKIAISEDTLAGALVDRSTMGNIKQEDTASVVLGETSNTVRASIAVTNRNLAKGYYIRNVGLFAKDPDEGEILYSISVADDTTVTPDYMPAFGGAGVTTFAVDLLVELSNASTVEVVIDDPTVATVAQIIALQQQVNGTMPLVTGTDGKMYKLGMDAEGVYLEVANV